MMPGTWTDELADCILVCAQISMGAAISVQAGAKRLLDMFLSP